MVSSRAARLWLLLALAAMPLASMASAAWSSEDSFATAEQALASAYAAVRLAEDAGADVSSSLAELNGAASALARAETLYRQEKVVEAAEVAGQAFATASRVTESAGRLRELAVARGADLLRLTLIEWAVSLSATVILGYLAWGWFARWYHVRLLSMVVAEAGRDES